MKEQGYLITNRDADKTKVGYVRCSAAEQNEARQIEAFKGLNLYKIYIDKGSARDSNRPLLRQMLDYVREGDTVYIKDFSRLARSTRELLEINGELASRGVKLISMKECFDTGTSTGKLMLTMTAAIYEFERENMLERQREGIAIAKKQGKYRGRKKIEKPSAWAEVYGLYKTRDISAAEAMKRLGLKRNTFYKFVQLERHTNTPSENVQNGPKQ